MRVVLFRHGPAGHRDPSRWADDAKRPLTARGEERTRAASRGLERMLPGDVTAVLTSPLQRARQTAKLVAEALHCERLEELDLLAPGGTPARTLRALAGYADARVIVVVGHEPDLGRLAAAMVFGSGAALPLKKAGALSVDFDGAPTAGEGDLAWLLPPRVLRRLARKVAT